MGKVNTLLVEAGKHRNGAEDTVRHMEDRYRSLTEATSDGILAFHLDGTLIEASPAVLWVMGQKPAFVPAPLRAYLRLVERSDRRAVCAALRQADARHGLLQIELQVRGYDPPAEATFCDPENWMPYVRRWRVRAVPLKAPNGALCEWIAAVTDITRQAADADALRQSEQRFRLLVEASLEGTWRADAEGSVVDVSEGWRRRTGTPAEVLQGNSWLDTVHEDDREAMWRTWRHSVETGTPYQCQYRVHDQDADGLPRILYRHVRAMPLRDPEGAVREWIGTLTDITGEVEAEAERSRSAEEMRSLITASAGEVWRSDAQGRLTQVTPGLLRFHGVTEAHIEAQMRQDGSSRDAALATITQTLTARSLAHPDDQEYVGRVRREALTAGTPYEYTARLHHADDPQGVYRWVRSHGVPLKNADGSVRAWIGMFDDVTESKEAELRVQESDERSRRLLEAFTDGTFRADAEGQLFEVSTRLAGLVGTAPGTGDVKAFEAAWQAAIHPEDRAGAEDAWRHSVRTARMHDARYRVTLAGQERVMRVQAAAVTNPDDTVREWIAAISDVTEVEKAAEAVRHSEERFRSLVQATTGGVWQADAQANLFSLTGDALTFVGISDSDIEQEMASDGSREDALHRLLTSVRMRDRIHPDDLPAYEREVEGAVQRGEAIEQAARLHRAGDPDGEYRIVRSCAVPLREADGTVREWIGTFTDATETVTAQQKLQQSERRLSLLIDVLGNGVFRADTQGRLVSVAPRLVANADISVKAILGSGWISLLHPEDIEETRTSWQAAIESKLVYTARFRLRTASGTYRYIRAMAVPLLDDAGQVEEWVGTVTNIHEQVEAEQQLRKNEERLREAQRLTKSGSWHYDIASDSLTWSDQMFALWEQPRIAGALTMQQMLSRFSDNDSERLERLLRWTIHHGTTFAQDFSALTLRDNRRWFQLIVQAERDGQGAITALFGTVLDITERKELEEESRRAQQFARRVALAVPDTLYVYNLHEGRTVYANREMGALLGYTPEEIRDLTRRAAPGPRPSSAASPMLALGGFGSVMKEEVINAESKDLPEKPVTPSAVETPAALIHPDDTTRLLSLHDRLRRARDGQVIETSFRQRHRDGQWRWLHAREMVFSRDSLGKPVEVMGLAQDITERKAAQDSLRESEEKYRSLVSLLSDWVWETDCDNVYTYVSPQVTTCLGYLPKEMTGLTLFDFMHLDDRARTRLLFGGIVRTRASVSSLTMRFISLSGEVVHLEVSGVPLYDPEGEWRGYRGVSRDVTRRREAEEALRNREERLSRLIESSPDSIATLDLEGRLLTLNDGGLRLMNLNDAQALQGEDWLQMLGVHAGMAKEAFTLLEPQALSEAEGHNALDRVREGSTVRFLCFKQNAHRSPQWWDVILAPLLGPNGKPEQILSIARDISSQKALEAQKDQLLAEAVERAEQDALTGVYDHRAFHQRLVEEGSRAQRTNGLLAVAIVDVDNFKFFNDAFGHLEGDAVLRHVAGALRDSVRPYDTVGRLGGDEFAILMPGVGRMEAYHLLTERIQANPLAGQWRPAGYDAPIPLRMSFGVAVFPDEAQTPLQTLHLADERLYRSKQDGHDGILESLRQELGETLAGFPMLDSLVTAVDGKDRYTRRHSEDVLVYAVMIAQALNLSVEELRTLRVAALLHDVGKIGVSSRILRLPAKLTDEEYEAIKQHAALGAGLVQSLLHQNKGATSSPVNLPQLISAVRHHHEAWNGKGYPDGLAGEGIPYLARILAVADSYSALTTDRPYRKGLNQEGALQVLRSGAGRQWDEQCVTAFLSAQTPQA